MTLGFFSAAEEGLVTHGGVLFRLPANSATIPSVTNPQASSMASRHKTAVLLPIDEYEDMLEELHLNQALPDLEGRSRSSIFSTDRLTRKSNSNESKYAMKLSITTITLVSMLLLIASLFLPRDLYSGTHVSAASAEIVKKDDDHSVAKRHFRGKRYLVLTETFVYREPNENSSIINDLLTLRMVYAEPAKDGWAKIYGSGLRRYPDKFQGFDGTGSLQFVDGKFVLPEAVDRDRYYAIDGYVRLSDLGPMETSPAMPIADHSLQPLPQLLAGIPETRRVPLDPTQYPFSSVVYIKVIRPGIVPKLVYLCTGFFVESKLTIASAGHCISEPLKNEKIDKIDENGLTYKAVFKRGSKDEEEMPLELIKHEFTGNLDSNSIDWALFRVADGRPRDVVPLSLPTLGAWTQFGGLEVMQMGFAVDMEFVKKKEFGASRVHVDRCIIPTSTIRVQSSGLQNVFPGAKCTGFHGDSGGPLVFYNQDAKRYEVLGITSWGKEVGDLSKAMDDRGSAYFAQRRNQLFQEYSVDQSQRDSPMSIPGVASLQMAARFFGLNKAEDGWFLNRNFIDALSKQTGSSKPTDAYLSQFLVDKTGLWVDRPRTTNEPHLEPFMSIPSVLDRYEKSLRSSLFETGEFQDVKYQQKLRPGDSINLERLKQQNIPFQVHAVAYSTVKLVVELSEVDSLIKELQDKFERKDGNILERASALSLKNQLEKFMVVRVGGDAFVADRKTGYVWGISRNWMNAFEGDFDKVRRHEDFPSFADAPIDRKYEPESDVPPQSNLRPSNFGAETPPSIPGGKAISVKEAWQLISNPDIRKRAVVLSAMDDSEVVPVGAINFAFGARGGDFNDATQKTLKDKLGLLKVNPSQPIIVFCHHEECWLSYNLGLRLIAAGYTNVNWMRDGIVGWVQWGLPVTKMKATP